MPDLVRIYIQSVAIGFGLALVFTGGLVWWDVAGIGRLIIGSDIGWVAAAMMVVFNGIVFSAVQFAIRIMALADDAAGPRGGHGARNAELIPIPVPVKPLRR